MLTQKTLQFFFQFLRNESGLVLDDSKIYLIETRLEPIAVQEGFPSIGALGNELMRKHDPELRQKVVDAMTTNETSFFRDRHPFEAMKNIILPDLIKTNEHTKRIRIWCAASSTGQEPYSIAMMLCDMESRLLGWDVRILATDIVESVLNKARKGIYSQHEVQRGLPMPYLLRYFTQSNTMWGLKESVKKFVKFQKVNLLSDFSLIGVSDVIFCRNILIYLDRETKENVLNRMEKILSPKGTLFLGGTEILFGTRTNLVSIGNNRERYYQKNGVPTV